MTVSSQNYRNQYTSTGATGYDFTFKILDEDHLNVYQTDGTTAVETLLTITTDYTVAGVGENDGGRVSLVSAPAAGDLITLVMNVPYTQETDWKRAGPMDPEILEKDLDKIVLRDLQMKEVLDRCLKISVGSDSAATADELMADINAAALAAQAAQTAAETAETNAETAETNAETALTAVQVVLMAVPTPGHRLTVTTASPVPANVTGQAVVYLTPHEHNRIVLDVGGVLTPKVGAEVSQTLADSSKSPAIMAADTNCDMFAWIDDGTFRCTRGPAWSSLTVRGTGAGTTELTRNNAGQWVNRYAITNGPAAGKGLYVGTVNTQPSLSQIHQTRGGADVTGYWGVWNFYNRCPIDFYVYPTADSWTYATAAWRQLGGSAVQQIAFVRGFDEDVMMADLKVMGTHGTAGQYIMVGIGLDVTNAKTGIVTPERVDIAGYYDACLASYCGRPGLGKHFLAALEYTQAATATFYGDAGVPLLFQSGLKGTLFA